MIKNIIFTICLTAGLMACRTTTQGLGGTEAPAMLSAEVGTSPEGSCELSGGEFIDGNCICSDGTFTAEFKGRASTCAQWIKLNYKACYDKGGTAKLIDNGHECYCMHGGIIDENGTQTCYQLFAQKQSRCANVKGMILADDRVCRCLHDQNSTVGSLEAQGQNCTVDHRRVNERCHVRGGLSRDGNLCECRDGTFIHKDENATCADKWFFHEDSLTINPNPTQPNPGQPNPGQPNPNPNPNPSQGTPTTTNATCRCQYYNGNVVLYKPNPQGAALARPIPWPDNRKAQVNAGICYDNFYSVINSPVQQSNTQGGCGGSWEYVAVPGTGTAANTNFSSEYDPKTMCACTTFNGGRDCGVFKPNSNSWMVKWPVAYGCGLSDCYTYGSSAEAVGKVCPKRNGNPLIRSGKPILN